MQGHSSPRRSILKTWTAAAVLLAFLLCHGGMSRAQGDWQPAPGHLMTRWAAEVSPTNALPEYPRPQMTRQLWQNLNGLWQYALTDKTTATPPPTYEGRILVPYPYESALSGVGKPSIPDQRLWYHRTFTIPAAWRGGRVILHFGAVTWDSSVLVNGLLIGAHRGGYDSFSFDITPALQPGENQLDVSAWNPLAVDTPDAQVLGKQRATSGNIYYSAATGIWQTVWLEPVPTVHIAALKMTPDIDNQVLHITVQAEGPNAGAAQVQIDALDGTNTEATLTGAANTELSLPLEDPHLWTPDDPYLYNLHVSLLQNNRPADTVDSYFAMRKSSLGQDAQGRTRIMLNNKFVFQVGALDQGYWPDGIYTAPTDAALRYDIETARQLGFNMLRKHAKVEPARWYYWADKLGMLVWQDMPPMFGGPDGALSETATRQFDTEWRNIIADHYNSPSIVVWTTFNQGWGQHDTERVAAYTKQLDPSRLVNSASGQTDKNVGDIDDVHHYPVPFSNEPSATRAAANGEFGGLGMRVAGHMWTQDSWGYQGLFSRPYQLTARYQQYLKFAYEMMNTRGTSAIVYTQITDVQQEANGLMTYDRAIIKPDPTVIRDANQGRFPPLPPDPNPPLVPTSEDQPQTWRYTTDHPGDDWSQPTFHDDAWQTGPGGFGHGTGGYGQGTGEIHTEWTTPDIWLRREVTLPDTIPPNLIFSVFHDEDIEIYLNGVLAGQATGYITGYEDLPMTPEGRAALKPGRNIIAMHVHQTTGGQFADLGIVPVPPVP